MNRRRLLSLLLLFIAISVNAQQLYRCDEKKTYWALERDSVCFSVTINGEAEPFPGQPKLVVIDKTNVLQYVINPIAPYMEGLEPADSATFKPIIAYAQSEAGYMSEQYHTQLQLHMENASVGNKKILLWYYDSPASAGGNAKAQLYATIIIGDRIVGLGTTQFEGQSFEQVKKVLLDATSTLEKVKGKADFARLCK